MTRCTLPRGERVTVQGPVRKPTKDEMSHGGGGGGGQGTDAAGHCTARGALGEGKVHELHCRLDPSRFGRHDPPHVATETMGLTSGLRSLVFALRPGTGNCAALPPGAKAKGRKEG